MRKSNTATETAPEEVTGEVVGEVNTNGEVVAVASKFSSEELSGITSWDDALALAQREYKTIVVADEVIGDGFKVADESDKNGLIGVPLFLLEWAFRAGDFGDYVSIRAIEQNSNGTTTKWILNDGGTGICRDLKDFSKKTGRFGGLLVRNGLRVSNFMVDSETNEVLSKGEYKDAIAAGRKTFPASTFYLDTSA